MSKNIHSFYFMGDNQKLFCVPIGENTCVINLIIMKSLKVFWKRIRCRL